MTQFRMWNVPVSLMCDDHLRDEHHFIHMIYKHLVNGKVAAKVAVSERRLDTLIMKVRHDALAKEMLKRGLVHNTPFQQKLQVEANNATVAQRLGNEMVHPRSSTERLLGECTKCAARSPYSSVVEQQVEAKIRAWAEFLDHIGVYTYSLVGLNTQPKFKYPHHGASST